MTKIVDLYTKIVQSVQAGALQVHATALLAGTNIAANDDMALDR